MALRAIFFDFDGVIMDSMQLKLDAYCHAFDGCGFTREDVDRLMRQHMGRSRHRILRLTYGELTGKEMSEEQFTAALDRFNRKDRESLPLMKLIPGSREFLEFVHAKFFTAVVTGTPQECIEEAVAFHQLGRYFDVLRGSPDTKTAILREQLAAHQLHPDECIFIGDGRTDQDAADDCGIRFVGFDNGDSSFAPERAWRVVRDLNELRTDVED